MKLVSHDLSQARPRTGGFVFCDGTPASLNEAVGSDCTVQFDWGIPISIRVMGRYYILSANLILDLESGNPFLFRLNEDGTVTWKEFSK